MRLGSLVRRWMSDHPLLSRMATTGGSALVADIVCQRVVEQHALVTTTTTTAVVDSIDEKYDGSALKNDQQWDWHRSLRLATFAGGFTGVFLHHWFNALNRHIVPTSGGGKAALLRAGALRMVIDMTVGFPLIVASFFGGVTLLEGKSIDEARSKIALCWWPTVKTGLMVFPAASLVVHSLLPPLYRVLCVNIITFFWTIYLSRVQHR